MNPEFLKTLTEERARIAKVLEELDSLIGFYEGVVVEVRVPGALGHTPVNKTEIPDDVLEDVKKKLEMGIPLKTLSNQLNINYQILYRRLRGRADDPRRNEKLKNS